MRKTFPLISTLLAVYMGCGSSAAELCPTLRFEPRQAISSRELRQMGDLQRFGPNPGTFAYWWFDYEDHPVEKGWSAIALVMAANGDLGEVPVVGIVWAKGKISTRADYDARLATSNDAVIPDFVDAMVFYSARAAKNCKAGSLALSSNGTQVFVDRKLVGEIKN